ncbi:hypothetical protein EJ02DRAFT_122102 [Clathrospora elynae]|uniref:Secreted protein n=1 Tax=Clathrospora elynae TaxID=706981 RepID=A0A6A5SVP2_9PLEO|nr:hypothetical protein EJ02DRAFT_122102 [Clathrospora elynae]
MLSPGSLLVSMGLLTIRPSASTASNSHTRKSRKRRSSTYSSPIWVNTYAMRPISKVSKSDTTRQNELAEKRLSLKNRIVQT